MFKLLGTINATKSNKNPTSLITYQRDLILFYTYKKNSDIKAKPKSHNQSKHCRCLVAVWPPIVATLACLNIQARSSGAMKKGIPLVC